MYDQAVIGLQEIYREWGGMFSHLCFTEMLGEKDIPVSKHTVQRILNNGTWASIRQKILPINTLRHQQERKGFCEQHLENSFGGDNCSDLWIDIDEKAFFQYSLRRIVYVPLEMAKEVDRYAHAVSKRMIPSVMFFGAVARPHPQRRFDGRILLTPVVKEQVAKRKFKFNNKRDVKLVPTTMIAALFKKTCF